MITYRTTGHSATADEAFAAMERHHARHHLGAPGGSGPPTRPPGETLCPGTAGDIIYGGRAIAQYLFGKADDRTRRRVFCLAQHYLARKEKAGFFKLKGALCLSRAQWAKFHGFG